MGEGYPGGFCPSFVSSSNYDLPHEYSPYVNIRAPAPLPSPARPIPSFGLLFLPLSVFLPLSFFFPYLSVSFFPRYCGADVISCSVGLQMHPRWRPRTPRMTDELQRRSFCLIGVYRTFQLRGERRGLLYQFSLSFLLSRLRPRSLVFFRDVQISPFPSHFFPWLHLRPSAGRRRSVHSMTRVKESGMRVGRRREEVEREEFIIMSQGARCPLRTICCSREKWKSRRERGWVIG